MELQHEYIYDDDGACVVCGATEEEDEPWLPQHLIPEGW